MNRLELAQRQPLYEWETPEGRLVERSAVNRHHVNFQRRNYNTPLEKQYRSMGGMILPMLITDHRELHAHIKPPKKPARQLMLHAVSFNEAIDTMTDDYEQFEQMIEFFEDVATMSTRMSEAKDAQSIAANYRLQEAFLLQGKVQRVGVRQAA